MPSPDQPAPAIRQVIVCGLKPVLATFAIRPKCVIRLFYTAATAKLVEEQCRWLAQERRVFRKLEPQELERVAGTVHHGGVVAVTERPPLRPPKHSEVDEWHRAGESLLILDRIGNPHNLGAIARTAAFFGITKMLIPRHPQQAQPNDAAYRIAEGGLEHIFVYEVGDLLNLVKQLGNRFLLVGTSVHQGRNLETAKPPRAPGRPTALFLGNEETGLDKKLAAQCELLVKIPGTGAVESLNVSAAAAILIHWVASGRAMRRSAGPETTPAPATAKTPAAAKNPGS